VIIKSWLPLKSFSYAQTKEKDCHLRIICLFETQLDYPIIMAMVVNAAFEVIELYSCFVNSQV
jgi:hypothetical protein